MVKLRNSKNNELVQTVLCRIHSWIDNNLDLDEFLDGLKGTDIWNLC